MDVLVVDNSVTIIERWIHLLSETENIDSVYGSASYDEASKLLKEINPGVVLVDCGLTENETFDLLLEIKRSGLKTGIIVLSSRYDEFIEKQCKIKGADFFLDKYQEFEKVPMIIREIAEDEKKIKY